MSYAVAAALQTAIYQTLIADTTVSGLIGTAVYDAVPSGAVPDLYISLGPEIASDASDKTGSGALHRFTISVISNAPGFATAKTLAAAICDALVDGDLSLSRGRVVHLNFDKAAAARIGAGNGRKIDLRFAARVEDD
ncbi:MAG: DUF3168 domain-containing protein [Paracoccaceae bacterium]